MDLRDNILKLWLPTKWSALIMGLTIASAALSTYLSEFLRRYDIQLTKEKTLLIRVSVPLLILWIGTFLVLLIVVHHSKTIRTQKQLPPPISPPIPKPIELPKEQTDILLLLFKQGELLTFQIAQRFDMLEDIAKYHLRELTKRDFVKEINLPGIGPPGQNSWFIDDKGKKYLIENKLIS